MEKTIKYLENGEYHYATVKDVGDLEQLKTQHKEDLVTALNELFTTGGDSKTNGYDDLVKKVNDTRTSLNGVNSEVSNVKNKIDQTANGINNTITDINGKVVANDEAITQAKKDLQDALTQFQTFNDEIEQAKKDAETKLADAKQALKDEFNNNLADAQKANQKQLEDKVAVIQGNLDTTSNTLNDVKTQLTNAKLDYGAVNTSIQKLNDTLSTKLSSTDLDPLRTSIQSQETEIQQAKDSIATKTSKAEFDVLSGRVGNAEANIKQQADEISLGVKKSELNGAIDNYQIEGANRLRNTIDFDIDGGYWKLDQYDIKSTADVHPYDQAHDVSVLVLQKTGSAKQDVDFTNEDLGQNFVVSMWNKKDAQPQVWYGNTQLTNRQVAEIKGDYERSFFTFIPTNVNVKTIMFKYDAGTVDQLVIGEPKLELGTKPKAYAPNPNDEHKQIVDTKAELKIASDKIESTVEKQTKTDDNINQLSSRITQTEQGITATNDLITKTKDGLIKDYTGKIDASAKSLSSEFDEKTDEKIGQITDSGENLILNSAFTNETDRKDKWQNISDKVNIVADNNGLMWAHMSQTGLTTDNPISLTSNYFPIKQGKITVGVDIKSDNTNGLSGAKILVLQTYNANKQRVDFTEISLENMGLTIQQLADGESHRGVYRLGNDRSDAVYMTVKAVLPRNGSIYFTNFSAKLSSIDNGGYTPNADDLKRQILNQKTKIEQNSQQITLKASSTELRDVQTIANGAVSVANQANSNANTANTNATNAVSVANNANNNANQANTNASSAVNTANTAKSTADSANNTANSAVNTANQANGNASQAVTTANSANTTANQANSKVAAIQANGGGVNLLPGTAKCEFPLNSNGGTQTVQKYDDETNYIQHTSNTPIDRMGPWWAWTPEVGQVYTLSADVCGNGYIQGEFHFEGGDNGSLGRVDLTDNWQRISNTFRINAINGWQNWTIYANNSTLLKVKNIQVEKGTVAHDWSPAPEDIQTQINQARTDIQSTLTVANNGITAATNLKTTYDNYVQKNDANIKLLGDRITNEVSKITSNGGGVNLLQGTGTASGDVVGGGGTLVEGAFNGYDAVKTNGAWQERFTNLQSALGRTGAKAGDWYTISVYVKADKQIDTGSLDVYRALGNVDANTNDGHLDGIQMQDKPITTQWQQYAWSFQLNDISLQRQVTRIEYSQDTGDNWIYWAGWMLEKGIVAHDWQPAPEDTQSQIEAVSSKIDQTATSITSTVNSTKQDLQGQIDSANTKITQTADSITEQLKSYSKTGDMQNYVNTTVQKTADGISTKVSGVESKVDSTKQDLQGQITQTANDINGKVSGVENKVDNASSKINDITSNGGGVNLIIQSDLQPGYLNTGDGSVVEVGSCDFHSDNYIATNGSTVFTFSSPDYVFKGSRDSVLVMYDSNKNYLGYQSITSPTQTLSKSNVTYIRFSINFVEEGGTANNLSDWLDNHRYMLEKGVIAHDWSPAPEDTSAEIKSAKDEAINVASGKIDNSSKELQDKIDNSNKELQGIKDITQWHTVGGPLDLNDLKNQTRIFYRDTQDKNSAVNGWQYIVVDSSSDEVTQTVWKDNSTIQYIRQFITGTWTNWVRQTNQNDIDEAKTGLREEIKSAKEAAINVAKDNIEIKVNELKTTYEETLNTKINEVKTASEKFTSDGIEQTVKKITEVQSNVDNLNEKVDSNNGGGINLQKGTKDFSFDIGTNGNPMSIETYNSDTKMLHTQNGGFYTSYSDSSFVPTPGEFYTFSADVKGDGVINGSGFRYEGGSNGTMGNITLSDTWQRIVNTVHVDKVQGQWVIYPINSKNLYVKHIKIERGTVATPWSPNPEDVEPTHTLETANIDDMKSQGHYFVHSLAGNPIGGWVYVDVTGNNNDRVKQDVYADQSNQHKYRTWNGSRWTSWEQGAYMSDVDNLKTETTASVKNLGDRVTTEVSSITTRQNDFENETKAQHSNDVELVRKSDFEDGSKGGWTAQCIVSATNPAPPSELGQSGMKVLQTNTRDAYEDGIWYSVKPDEKFDVDYWCAPSSAFHTTFGLVFYDKNNQVLNWLGIQTDQSGQWKHYTGTITAPANAAFARPWYQMEKPADNTSNTAWIAKPHIRRQNPQVAEKISELNTKWDVANGQIQGKVTETQVNDILNGKGYATQSWAESNFRMKSDSIALEVKEITDPISNRVNNLQVGGRNLAKNTDQDIVIDDTANKGSNGWCFYSVFLTQQPKVGDQITVSAEGTLTGKGDLSKYTVILYNSVTSDARSNQGQLIPGKRSAVTLKLDNNNGNGETILLIYSGIPGDTEGKKNVIHHLKVEFGNVATDWSPAPEDVDQQITDTNRKIDTQTLDSANIDDMRTQGHYFVKNLTGNPIGGWVYVDVNYADQWRIRQDVYQDGGENHKYRRWFGNYWTEWIDDVNSKNVVSAINITPDQIKIASNKIVIDGDTDIHGVLRVSDVKLAGRNGIVDLSGDGINITKNNGAGINISNNGIQLTANTNGQNEIEGFLTTAWSMNNKNQNGIGLIVTTQQDLGSPYGGDILTIGSMPKPGLIHAAMVFDATGITSDYKRGFNWMAPHYLSGDGGVLRFPGSQDDLLLNARNLAGSRQSNFYQPTMSLVNGQYQGTAGLQFQWDDLVPFGRITSSMSYMSAVGTDGNDGLTVSWYSWSGWYGGRKVPSLVSTSPDGSRRNGGFAFYPGGEVCFWQGDFRSNFRWSGLHNDT